MKKIFSLFIIMCLFLIATNKVNADGLDSFCSNNDNKSRPDYESICSCNDENNKNKYICGCFERSQTTGKPLVNNKQKNIEVCSKNIYEEGEQANTFCSSHCKKIGLDGELNKRVFANALDEFCSNNNNKSLPDYESKCTCNDKNNKNKYTCRCLETSPSSGKLIVTPNAKNIEVCSKEIYEGKDADAFCSNHCKKIDLDGGCEKKEVISDGDASQGGKENDGYCYCGFTNSAGNKSCQKIQQICSEYEQSTNGGKATVCETCVNTCKKFAAENKFTNSDAGLSAEECDKRKKENEENRSKSDYGYCRCYGKDREDLSCFLSEDTCKSKCGTPTNFTGETKCISKSTMPDGYDIPVDSLSCKEIIGNNMYNLLKIGITIFQAGCVIFALVKGMLILVPPIISKDANALQKSFGKLVLFGCILLAALLFRPIVTFIGDLADFDTSCITRIFIGYF